MPTKDKVTELRQLLPFVQEDRQGLMVPIANALGDLGKDASAALPELLNALKTYGRGNSYARDIGINLARIGGEGETLPQGLVKIALSNANIKNDGDARHKMLNQMLAAIDGVAIVNRQSSWRDGKMIPAILQAMKNHDDDRQALAALFLLASGTVYASATPTLEKIKAELAKPDLKDPHRQMLEALQSSLVRKKFK